MIDIKLLRVDQGGDPEKVREWQRQRGASVELVDEVVALDQAWRTARTDLDKLKKETNALDKEIGALKKEKKNADALVAKKAEQKKAIAELEAKEKELEKTRDDKLSRIGNEVHHTVAMGLDEDTCNKTERTHGEKTKKPYVHHQVLEMIDGYESTRGVRVAGHRGYFLKGPGVLLNLALINYGLAFCGARGYMPIQPPFMMRKTMMAKTAQLEDFDDALYKVEDGAGEPDDEKYLIATSEQPISALHATEWLTEKQLPIKYAGFSSCFRKEAGKHGKETWGIFRVHQFEKIEQFVITEPEKSWEAHDEMVELAEAFYQSLGLSYRVVNICSGALNNAAAKKYDIEAWFPGMQEYKELVSASNCTDYQSRSLEVRCGSKKAGDREKKYVHMLNATLCATERCLSCILENYQSDDGVIIPEVLRPFMGGMEKIPYSKPCPENKEEKPQKEKGKGKEKGSK